MVCTYTIQVPFSFAAGGCCDSGNNNTICQGSSAFIGSGDHNYTWSDNAFIGAGQSNNVMLLARYSSIVGGQQNTISPNAQNSMIGGGLTNTVSGSYASIVGGLGNSVSGNYSVILGGQGNSDGGLNNVFIAGSGITAVNANSLHVEGLWANGLPVWSGTGSYPPGTVFIVPTGVGVPAFAQGQLWIA